MTDLYYVFPYEHLAEEILIKNSFQEGILDYKSADIPLTIKFLTARGQGFQTRIMHLQLPSHQTVIWPFHVVK